jgi:AcrR family transcriptional regulator
VPTAGQTVPTDTRERILAATWKLMEEAKDLQVRIADIAAAAGVSRQAVYLHFGNRANLLLAAVQYRDMTSPTGAIKRAAEEEPIPEALANFVAAWFAHIPRIQPVAGLLAAASQIDPEARVAWDDRMALLRRLSLALAQRLSDGGALRPEWTVQQAADWIWHRTHLDGWRHLVAERDWDAAEYGRRVSASLARDLLKENAGRMG